LNLIIFTSRCGDNGVSFAVEWPRAINSIIGGIHNISPGNFSRCNVYAPMRNWVCGANWIYL